MCVLSRLRSVVALVAVFACIPVAGHAAVQQSRITSAVVDSQTVALDTNVNAMVKIATDNGRVEGSMPLTNLTLNFQPSAVQESALATLLDAQQNPASASYHKWLTAAQYGAQFGLSQSDLSTVTAWLQGHGFSVDSIPDSRNSIHFSGTAAQVSDTFHTEIHAYVMNGEAHFANATAPALPSAFVGMVSSIRGLTDFKPKAHLRQSAKTVPYSTDAKRASGITPKATDGSGNEYLAPEDFASIYDVKALYNAGFNGSASYPIGVIGQTAIRPADITDFRSSFGLSTTNVPTLVLMPGTGNSAVLSTDDLSESDLDLEWSGAVAPSAPIYFIYTGNTKATNGGYAFGVFDALQYAIQTYTVNSKPLPIITISYGLCESADSPANLATYEAWFKQANAQGQTILAAAGDSGAADCDNTTTAANSYQATQGLAVDYPGSSVYVTSMGGTSFTGDLTSQSTYWGTSNDANFGNELGLYIPAGAWDDTPTAAAALSFMKIEAGGGGASALWQKPSWQAGISGIPADSKRDVPDISLHADPEHDGYLVCTNLGCEGANGSFNIFGGTSVAAPSFAGVLALTEQKLGASQGNINPQLYALAANPTTYQSAFHDVTTGSNIVPCVVTANDTGCTTGLFGYSAGTGYDQATGLGAIDAFNLAAVFGTGTIKLSSTTAVTASPTAALTGQTVTFTAQVTPASGTVTPTGSFFFAVDTATTGTTVAANGSGVATFTTTFTTGGAHTVTATYSGDGTYYSSIGTASVGVTVAPSATNAATTTSLKVSSASVAVGSSLTLTATVTSTVAGTIAGSVTFTTPSGTLGTATVSAGTATLTLPVAIATLPVGTDTITATFGGGGINSNGGTFLTSSGTAAVTVANPSITLTGTNLTVGVGSTGTSTITVTPGGGYIGTVALTASSTSSALNGTYTFSPTSVAITSTGAGTSTFSFTSTASSARGGGTFGGVSMLLTGGGLSFAGLLFFGFSGMRRKRWSGLLFSVLVMSALACAMGCSSSSTAVSGKGTFPITIVGTDATNNVTGSTTITLIVN